MSKEKRFLDLPVEDVEVHLGRRPFRVLKLQDPAKLIDHPEIGRAMVEEGKTPYGLELWPAALMLGDAIMAGEPGEGRAALDLGCGVGLTALAAAANGWRVTAADYDDHALEFTRANAERNGLEIDSLINIDWHDLPSMSRFDAVFAADVLYQDRDVVPVIECLQATVDRNGFGVVADSDRPAAHLFEAAAHEHGFRVRIERVYATVPGDRPSVGRLFFLTWRGRKKSAQ